MGIGAGHPDRPVQRVRRGQQPDDRHQRRLRRRGQAEPDQEAAHRLGPDGSGDRLHLDHARSGRRRAGAGRGAVRRQSRGRLSAAGRPVDTARRPHHGGIGRPLPGRARPRRAEDALGLGRGRRGHRCSGCSRRSGSRSTSRPSATTRRRTAYSRASSCCSSGCGSPRTPSCWARRSTPRRSSRPRPTRRRARPNRSASVARSKPTRPLAKRRRADFVPTPTATSRAPSGPAASPAMCRTLPRRDLH